jgi:protein-tyrosine phosphatase
MATRRVTLEGPCNFRDLGGYPTADGRETRWGRLYRSDSMHTLTAADVPVLQEIGVRTAIDFRSNHELDQIGIGPLGDVSITHVHCPTFDMNPDGEAPPFVGASAATFYARMMESGAPAYVAAAKAVADADAMPAVFFCMAGKDRTGVFAALVLGLVGVPDDVIVADYALTHEVIDTIGSRREAREAALNMRIRWEDIPEDLKGAHSHVMEELISLMRARWGSWDGYADAVGFPPDTLAALRAQLVDA